MFPVAQCRMGVADREHPPKSGTKHRPRQPGGQTGVYHEDEISLVAIGQRDMYLRCH